MYNGLNVFGCPVHDKGTLLQDGRHNSDMKIILLPPLPCKTNDLHLLVKNIIECKTLFFQYILICIFNCSLPWVLCILHCKERRGHTRHVSAVLS